MKHYIPELTIHNSHNLKKLHKKEENYTLFICPDGQYTIKNNIFYKYTFPNSTGITTTNYIHNYTLLSTETETVNTNKAYWRLPPENIIKEINKSIFTTHPKSQTAFVIESCEGNRVDSYFQSPHNVHQKTLKEDITSLLSYLK